MSSSIILLAICVWGAVAAPILDYTLGIPEGAEMPLFEYVNAPDDSYSYFDTGYRLENKLEGWKGYLLNMTSQTWLDPSDFVGSIGHVWTHQLMVIVPDTIADHTWSMVYVTGNSNGDGPPAANDEDIIIISMLAMESNTITAALFQIPNQPIEFVNDPDHKERGEDALMAFGWEYYMQHLNESGSYEWVAQLPMTKAVVRAMDTVQDYTAKNFNGAIENFVIAGASKRGWTTWLTGAVDGGVRVKAIAPIVMDMLNFYKNVPHMTAAYGGFTFAFTDYCQCNITQYLGTPPFMALANILDPLVYKATLTMPKLVIDSTGDEFFMPDDDYLWWGMLEGETNRLMIANAEHSMATGIVELMRGARAYYAAMIADSPRPVFNWTMAPNGTITVTTQDKPSGVIAWYAESSTMNNVNGKRRDFRLIVGDTPADPCHFIPVHVFGNACVNPCLWFPVELQPQMQGDTFTYTYYHPEPKVGWIGYFIEMEYPGPSKSNYRLTSQVSIQPPTYPYEECQGASCAPCVLV